MKQVKRNQGGFTLVEIAIVLVIIGLLLGGVLKGQEMIENAKVKNGIADINGITAAYNSYNDRFKRQPGDDGGTTNNLVGLTSRGGNWLTVTAAGNGNGVLNITQAQVFNPVTESLAFWQSLRAAGFIGGSPATIGIPALPDNAFNGKAGVGPGTGTAVTAQRSICLSQVPGKAARAMDVQLDDGVATTGSFTATLGVVGANTAPGAVAVANYIDTNQYTVCKTL